VSPRRARSAVAPAVLAALVHLAGSSATAQDWHEAYRAGVAALARGDAARAVTLLERAIQAGPEPGRNVVTYGTNVEARYYPFLRLAEAHLLLGDLDAARGALARSAARGGEPAEERARIAARIEAAAERARPRSPAPREMPPAEAAAPVPPSLPAPPPSPPPPSPTPAARAASPAARGSEPPAREAGPLSERTPAAGTPRPDASRGRSVGPAAGRREDADRSAPRRAGDAEPPRSPGAAARSPSPSSSTAPSPGAGGSPAGSIVLFSDPAGASVFLDDEPMGTTDPVSGRWVKSGVPPGRHQLRLSAPRYTDLIQQLEVAPGSATHFRGALATAPTTDDGRTLAALALVVFLAGLGAAAWVWRSRSRAGGAEFRELLARGTGGWRRSTPRRPGGRTPSTPREATPPFDAEGPFGEYRLLGVLGRGGMAVVYRAERRGEVCALKRPLPGLLHDPDFVQRFLREAEIGRTLHHPNIVRILDRGEVEAVPYFTMELIHGETLMARLRSRGALEPREGAFLMAAVGEALDYAHMKGVVHRDLKPSNVMVADDGLVKVTDYGIARARRFEGLTITGAFLGTPEYVAPETIEGGPADGRSDLYSLGVVFYEVLTGRRPFVADTPFAILRRHLTDEPVPPSLLDPRVPRELEAIVLKLLQKSPASRYAGAEDLVVDLRDFLNRAA